MDMLKVSVDDCDLIVLRRRLRELTSIYKYVCAKNDLSTNEYLVIFFLYSNRFVNKQHLLDGLCINGSTIRAILLRLVEFKFVVFFAGKHSITDVGRNLFEKVHKQIVEFNYVDNPVF